MLWKQVLIWLASVCLTLVTTFHIPMRGCMSGYQWAVCWRFPKYGYSVAVSAYRINWATSGCVPGADFRQASSPYHATSWWCSLSAP